MRMPTVHVLEQTALHQLGEELRCYLQTFAPQVLP